MHSYFTFVVWRNDDFSVPAEEIITFDRAIGAEDKAMLEQVPGVLPLDQHATVSVRSDKASVEWRRQFAAILASGWLLIGAIAATVVVMLAVSYGLARLLGLKTKLAILIACGNSICGNSAIAAVAPVIEADGDDIASSISFTAILGVLMVLGLPLLIPLLKLTATQYGILAGLTVYAVPQVLAATVPAGIVSTQIGTLVKLVRVLMLGPIVVALSLVVARRREGGPAKEGAAKTASISPFKLVPWFIIGFLVLAALRSFQLVPDIAIAPVTRTAAILTVLSMAALGLGVDVRVLSTVGGRVTAAVTLSLMLLLGLSIGLVHCFK